MTTLSLYEISETILALFDEWNAANERLANAADEDERLVAEAALAEIEVALSDFGDDLSAKAEGYAKLIRNLEAESGVLRAKAAPFAEEVTRYLKRAEAVDAKVVRLKGWLLENLKKTGVQKITGVDLSVRRQTNASPSIETVDIDAVPREFLVPQPPKLDTAAVRNAWNRALGAVDAVPGLRVVRGEHIRIS